MYSTPYTLGRRRSSIQSRTKHPFHRDPAVLAYLLPVMQQSLVFRGELLSLAAVASSSSHLLLFLALLCLFLVVFMHASLTSQRHLCSLSKLTLQDEQIQKVYRLLYREINWLSLKSLVLCSWKNYQRKGRGTPCNHTIDSSKAVLSIKSSHLGHATTNARHVLGHPCVVLRM